VKTGTDISKSHKKEIEISFDIELFLLKDYKVEDLLNWVSASPTENKIPLVVALVGRGYFSRRALYHLMFELKFISIKIKLW
jgi:hypothetical protein